MSCKHCGRQCIEPHIVDIEDWEICPDGCHEPKEECCCRRCDCGTVLKTKDERLDDTCQKCMIKGV